MTCPDRARRCRHLHKPGGVGHQVGDLASQSLRCEVLLLDQDRATVVTELACILDLVVLRCAGPRHDHRRHAHNGKLGDRCCARPGHHQIGCGIDERHSVLVSTHSIHDAPVTIATGRGIGQIAVAHDVIHHQIVPIAQEFNRFGGHLVQSPGTERATHDGHEETVVGQIEVGSGIVPVAGPIDGEDLLAHRCAGEVHPRQRRAIEGHRARRGATCHQLRDQAGSTVVTHHHDGHAAQHRSDGRRRAGIPADVDDDPWRQRAEQFARLPRRADELGHERQVAHRHRPLQPDDVEQGVVVSSRWQQPALDTPSRTDVVDRVTVAAAGDERIGHGERGEHVPRSAATRHHGEGDAGFGHDTVTSRCGPR